MQPLSSDFRRVPRVPSNLASLRQLRRLAAAKLKCNSGNRRLHAASQPPRQRSLCLIPLCYIDLCNPLWRPSTQRNTMQSQVQHHRLHCKGVNRSPARFADASHLRYYAPPAASSKGSRKVQRRISEQRDRLRLLSERLPSQPTAENMQILVQELCELSERLCQVSEMAAESSSSSSSSSSSGSEMSDGELHQRTGKLTQLAGLGTELLPTSLPAEQPNGHQPPASPPAQAIPTSTPRHDISSTSQWQESDVPRGVHSNIVSAPQGNAATVSVCQGKACAKRGAQALLQQASAATADMHGVDVMPCKCLGKCKKGPTVRVRQGREKPTILTSATADGGAELAAVLRELSSQQLQTARETVAC